MLRRLPPRLKDSRLVHFHGGKQNAELREALKDWFVNVSALQPVTPPSKNEPSVADFAVLLPRCEVACCTGSISSVHHPVCAVDSHRLACDGFGARSVVPQQSSGDRG